MRSNRYLFLLPQYLSKQMMRASLLSVIKKIKNFLCLQNVETFNHSHNKKKKGQVTNYGDNKGEKQEGNNNSLKVQGFSFSWIIFFFSGLPESPSALQSHPSDQGTRPRLPSASYNHGNFWFCAVPTTGFQATALRTKGLARLPGLQSNLCLR